MWNNRHFAFSKKFMKRESTASKVARHGGETNLSNYIFQASFRLVYSVSLWNKFKMYNSADVENMSILFTFEQMCPALSFLGGGYEEYGLIK
jgi:hypothetical protein